MKQKERIEDVTTLSTDDLVEGVRLVFRDRRLMWVKQNERGIYSLVCNVSTEEAEHITFLNGTVQTYDGRYRICPYTFSQLPDGRELKPPRVTDHHGDLIATERIAKGIPNGTMADVYIWAKHQSSNPNGWFDESMFTPRGYGSGSIEEPGDRALQLILTGIQIKPKIKVDLTSRGFELVEEEII